MMYCKATYNHIKKLSLNGRDSANPSVKVIFDILDFSISCFATSNIPNVVSIAVTSFVNFEMALDKSTVPVAKSNT